MEAMTEDEYDMDGNMDNAELENNIGNKGGDSEETKDAGGVNSSTRVRNLATDVTIRGISWQDRLKKERKDRYGKHGND